MLVSFVLEGKKEYIGSICQDFRVKNQFIMDIGEWSISPVSTYANLIPLLIAPQFSYTKEHKISIPPPSIFPYSPSILKSHLPNRRLIMFLVYELIKKRKRRWQDSIGYVPSWMKVNKPI